MPLVGVHRAVFLLLYALKPAWQLNNRSRTGIAMFAILMGIINISLAKNTGYNRPKTTPRTALPQARSRPSIGNIQNPYDAKDYMSRLAGKLSPKQRNILLRGPDVKKREALTERLRKPLLQPRFPRGQIPRFPRGEVPRFPPSGVPAPGPSVEAQRYQPLIDKELELRYAAEMAKKHWSLAEDLEKYRVYAVKEGSRTFVGSIRKAGFHAGLAVEDLVNVFTLASSDRAIALRENDGQPISFYLEKVGQAGAETLGNILITLYSSADLITLDALSDLETAAYRDNHVLVRPFVYTGRSIGSAWKTVECVGNVPTFGYFDNVTGSAGMFYENAVETVKHGCQAVTNLPRGFIRLGGPNEGLDRIQDWIWLVPLEYLSNVIQMKGISNAYDYRNAIKSKGVIGSILEMGGSTYLALRAVDEILDDDGNGKKQPLEEILAEEAPAEPAPPTNGTVEIPESGIYIWSIDFFLPDS
ncbi:MAG: hypothetical protein ACE5NM_00055 [Sedimentisphaerales bacterium]